MMRIAAASVKPELPVGNPSILTSKLVSWSILDDDINGVEARSTSAEGGMASKFQGGSAQEAVQHAAVTKR